MIAAFSKSLFSLKDGGATNIARPTPPEIQAKQNITKYEKTKQQSSKRNFFKACAENGKLGSTFCSIAISLTLLFVLCVLCTYYIKLCVHIVFSMLCIAFHRAIE